MNPKEHFHKQAYKILAETAQQLQDDGVPDRFIAELTAIQLARLNRPSMTEIAKSMFPIESMPLPNYFFKK
jgi:hypothetical protein